MIYTTDDLTELFTLFVQGIPVGALLSGIVWAAAFAVDLLKRVIMSS